MIQQALIVGCGGFIGSVLRFLSNSAAIKFFPQNFVWLGTFSVNIVGCFLIGLFSVFLSSQDSPINLKFFLMVGLLGGFTTYSGFALESFNLFKEKQVLLAVADLLLHLVFGLVAVYLGMMAGNKGVG